ncbi:4-coumarate--CoA ligase 6-like protein [Tanacetum coccineum]
MSYSELQPLVKSIAYGLHHEFGISKGDVVLMLLPNSVHFHIIFLGVVYLGAIVTTMNPLSTASEIKKQTRDCNVKLAFTVSSRVEELRALGIVSIRVPENANFDPNHVDFSCFQKLRFLGSSIVVMNKFDHNEMVRAIDKYGVSHFPAVPPLLNALTRTGKSFYSAKLKSLKQVSCGAAPLSTKSIEEFVQTFPHVDFIQVRN